MTNEINIEIGILKSIIEYLEKNSDNNELTAKMVRKLRAKKIDELLNDEDDSGNKEDDSDNK